MVMAILMLLSEKNDGNINFFLNVGSSSAAIFYLSSTSPTPFGLSDIGINSAPTFVDIDDDGDFDAFVGERDGNINFFLNTGSSALPAFNLSASSVPYGLSDIGDDSAPTFVDIDDDGDFDAFVGGAQGNINFFINLGSPSVPSFYLSTTSTAPFGLSDNGSKSAPTFIDIDGDGDFDAFVGGRNGGSIFFRNTGSTSAPSFTFSIPFATPGFDVLRIPTFVDIDGDDDFDAFIGTFSGTIEFFENIGPSSAPVFILSTSQSPFGLFDIGDRSSPTFVDIDGDGDFDAFVGEREGNINFFKNTGTSALPAFNLSASFTPYGLSDIGTDNAPTFVDIDGDGDFDAFVGESDDGRINFFLNTGSASAANFYLLSSPTPFGLSGVGSDSVPTFVDIDSDGDFDAFVGEEDGNTNFFLNTGTSALPAFNLSVSSIPFGLSDIGRKSSPTFVDIDMDGDFDAFIGEVGGDIIFFENRPCPDAIETNHVLLHQDQFVSEDVITSAAVIRSGRSVHFSGEQGLEINADFEVKGDGAMEVDTKGCKE